MIREKGVLLKSILTFMLSIALVCSINTSAFALATTQRARSGNVTAAAMVEETATAANYVQGTAIRARDGNTDVLICCVPGAGDVVMPVAFTADMSVPQEQLEVVPVGDISSNPVVLNALRANIAQLASAPTGTNQAAVAWAAAFNANPQLKAAALGIEANQELTAEGLIQIAQQSDSPAPDAGDLAMMANALENVHTIDQVIEFFLPGNAWEAAKSEIYYILNNAPETAQAKIREQLGLDRTGLYLQLNTINYYKLMEVASNTSDHEINRIGYQIRKSIQNRIVARGEATTQGMLKLNYQDLLEKTALPAEELTPAERAILRIISFIDNSSQSRDFFEALAEHISNAPNYPLDIKMTSDQAKQAFISYFITALHSGVFTIIDFDRAFQGTEAYRHILGEPGTIDQAMTSPRDIAQNYAAYSLFLGKVGKTSGMIRLMGVPSVAAQVLNTEEQNLIAEAIMHEFLIWFLARNNIGATHTQIDTLTKEAVAKLPKTDVNNDTERDAIKGMQKNVPVPLSLAQTANLQIADLAMMAPSSSGRNMDVALTTRATTAFEQVQLGPEAAQAVTGVNTSDEKLLAAANAPNSEQAQVLMQESVGALTSFLDFLGTPEANQADAATVAVLKQQTDNSLGLMEMPKRSGIVAASSQLQERKGTILIDDSADSGMPVEQFRLMKEDVEEMRTKLSEGLNAKIVFMSEGVNVADITEDTIIISTQQGIAGFKSNTLYAKAKYIPIAYQGTGFLPIEGLIAFAKGVLVYDNNPNSAVGVALGNIYKFLTGSASLDFSQISRMTAGEFIIQLMTPVIPIDDETYEDLHRRALLALIAA